MNRTVVTGLLLLLSLSACGTLSEDRKALIDKPIDCNVAEADLQALHDARPSTGERVYNSVTSLEPIGLSVGGVSGTQQDKWAIANGEFERQIDQKVAEIKTICGL